MVPTAKTGKNHGDGRIGIEVLPGEAHHVCQPAIARNSFEKLMFYHLPAQATLTSPLAAASKSGVSPTWVEGQFKGWAFGTS